MKETDRGTVNNTHMVIQSQWETAIFGEERTLEGRLAKLREEADEALEEGLMPRERGRNRDQGMTVEEAMQKAKKDWNVTLSKLRIE